MDIESIIVLDRRMPCTVLYMRIKRQMSLDVDEQLYVIHILLARRGYVNPLWRRWLSRPFSNPNEGQVSRSSRLGGNNCFFFFFAWRFGPLTRSRKKEPHVHRRPITPLRNSKSCRFLSILIEPVHCLSSTQHGQIEESHSVGPCPTGIIVSLRLRIL